MVSWEVHDAYPARISESESDAHTSLCSNVIVPSLVVVVVPSCWFRDIVPNEVQIKFKSEKNFTDPRKRNFRKNCRRMRGSSSAPEIGDSRIVERVAELYVDTVAGLNLPRVVFAPERAWHADGNRRALLFDASLATTSM